jgi:hypothetical protein
MDMLIVVDLMPDPQGHTERLDGMEPDAPVQEDEADEALYDPDQLNSGLSGTAGPKPVGGEQVAACDGVVEQ